MKTKIKNSCGRQGCSADRITLPHDTKVSKVQVIKNRPMKKTRVLAPPTRDFNHFIQEGV